MGFEAVDNALELIQNVRPVTVEQQQDSVGALRTPFNDVLDQLPAFDALLLVAENSRHTGKADVVQKQRREF